MKYSFTCAGHENITATHKTTLMFTKDDFVTKRGDCIVGCRCDFDLDEFKKSIGNGKDWPKGIKMTISTDSVSEEVVGSINPNFENEHEMVIRKGDFLSSRTLGFRSNKAAKDLSSNLKILLKSPMNVIRVSIQPF